MNEQMKHALHWMSPTNFDGNPIGAMVRTVEVITVDVVGIALFQSFNGVDCAGSIALVTLAYMARQFALCPRHDVERIPSWKKRWSIRASSSDQES